VALTSWRARFGTPPILPPEIDVPRRVCCYLAKIESVGGYGPYRGIALPRAGAGDVYSGQLVRARQPDLGLRLEDTRRRDPHVIILLERRANQFLQLLILENFPPLLFAERLRGGAGRFLCRQPAERGRGVGVRPLVIWSDRAAGEKDTERAHANQRYDCRSRLDENRFHKWLNVNSGAGFSLRVLVLARTNPHRLKPAPRKPVLQSAAPS
jgi:hypothetical protein